jgi:hypothetical protein
MERIWKKLGTKEYAFRVHNIENRVRGTMIYRCLIKGLMFDGFGPEQKE